MSKPFSENKSTSNRAIEMKQQKEANKFNDTIIQALTSPNILTFSNLKIHENYTVLKSGESEVDGVFFPNQEIKTKQYIQNIYGFAGQENCFITHRFRFSLAQSKTEDLKKNGDDQEDNFSKLQDIFGLNEPNTPEVKKGIEFEEIIAEQKPNDEITFDDDEEFTMDSDSIGFVEVKLRFTDSNIKNGIMQLISRSLSFLLFKIISNFKNGEKITPFFNSNEKDLSNETLLKKNKLKLFLIYNGVPTDIQPEIIMKHIKDLANNSTICKMLNLINPNALEDLGEWINRPELCFIYTTADVIQKVQLQKVLKDEMQSLERRLEQGMERRLEQGIDSLERRLEQGIDKKMQEMNEEMKERMDGFVALIMEKLDQLPKKPKKKKKKKNKKI